MCKSAVHLHMHTQMVYGIFCSNIGFVYIATQLLLLWIWFGGTLLHMWECEYKWPDQLHMPSCLCNHYFMQLLINYHASVTSCDPFLYTALHIILLVLCLYARYIRLVQAVYSFITLKIYVGLNIFPWCVGHSGASSLAHVIWNRLQGCDCGMNRHWDWRCAHSWRHCQSTIPKSSMSTRFGFCVCVGCSVSHGFSG